jgi:hypothetical protein
MLKEPIRRRRVAEKVGCARQKQLRYNVDSAEKRNTGEHSYQTEDVSER